MRTVRVILPGKKSAALPPLKGEVARPIPREAVTERSAPRPQAHIHLPASIDKMKAVSPPPQAHKGFSARKRQRRTSPPPPFRETGGGPPPLSGEARVRSFTESKSLKACIPCRGGKGAELHGKQVIERPHPFQGRREPTPGSPGRSRISAASRDLLCRISAASRDLLFPLYVSCVKILLNYLNFIFPVL